MYRRKVELVRFDDEQFDYGNRRKAVDDAVGYLSMWGFGSDRYLDVSIWANERTKELTATYKNGHGQTTFVMGAVEREDGTYSFHS